jgi:S-adenosylmethionine:tRNA ribosyltransferase-isomerase
MVVAEIGLRTEQLDYELPPELIAKEPVEPRDHCRLLVLHRATGQIEHRTFHNIGEYLNAGDCLVLNTTKVRKARLLGQRRTGGRVEALLLRPQDDTTWFALCKPAVRMKRGERIKFDGKVWGEVIAAGEDGERTIRFESPMPFDEFLEAYGHVPLPPYINRLDNPRDAESYQTVYAREPGAVAAPTAGLHFTARLLDSIRANGTDVAEVLLHVGPGTFRPILTETIHGHRLDPEWYSITSGAIAKLRQCRERGRRIIAVGTTSVRVLETVGLDASHRERIEGWADLLIAPPYDFRAVDAMITNFHLPRTSLLALVAAFAGLDNVMRAYESAISERYRFYSYGDAMLIV